MFCIIIKNIYIIFSRNADRCETRLILMIKKYYNEIDSPKTVFISQFYVFTSVSRYLHTMYSITYKK